MKKKQLLILIISVLLFTLRGNAIESPKAPPNSTQVESIETLFDKFARDYLMLSPESAVFIGIGKSMGYDVIDDGWDNESEEAFEKINAFKLNYLELLKKYDLNKLTPSQRRDAEILNYVLQRDLEVKKFRGNSYIISTANNFHNIMTTIMVDYYSIENLHDAQTYISRLEKYGEKFNQLSLRLKTKEKNHQLPPKHIIKKFSDIFKDFINKTPETNVLATSFSERIQTLPLEIDEKAKLIKKAQETISSVVYPAYQSMITLLDQLKADATQEEGVWKLPQGDEYYQYCLKLHTGTDMTPEEIYKLGLKEVRRIQQEIKRYIARAGYQEDLPFYDLLHYFWGTETRKNFDKLYFPTTRQGKLDALQAYQKHIDDVTKQLPEYFSIFPKAKLLIKPVPWYKISISGAHYESPSLDGKRPGAFYMSFSFTPFKPGMKTLAVHEGIPGHHFQLSITQESKEIRTFRHLLAFTAYVEGWALYAEKLAMENGWFEDIYSRIGYLESELLRAVRLVLDTGIHYKHWNYERAFSYMRDNLGWATTGEIDRYITWPGQACAYKIGELKILELRKKAQKALKNKFDIKEFHTQILKHGSVPWFILEECVSDYIKRAK